MPIDREELQARLRTLFVEELAENVLVLNRGLVSLEQGDSDDDDLVHEMFRAAHSLKGGAHSAGVPELVELCHRMEDVLSRVRDGTLAAATHVVEPMLRATDALSAAGERLRNNRPAAGDDLGEAGRQLAALARAPDRPPTTRPVEARQPAETPVSPARRDQGVRVPAERLDSLINQFGEMSHATRDVEGLAEAIRGLASEAHRHAKARANGRPNELSSEARTEWRNLGDDLEGLARTTLNASRRLETLGLGMIDTVRQARMTPLANAYDGLERVVRDLSRDTGKDVRLTVEGGDVEVERPILEVIADAVLHLTRNAVDHGIEPPEGRTAVGKAKTGRIRIEASLVQGGVSVSVADDGRGIDVDGLRIAARRRNVAVPEDDERVPDLAFAPGVSTAPLITEVSGRGVGLDAVRARVEGAGGSVRMETALGTGCMVTLHLPLALSALRVVLVRSASEVLALPSSTVTRLVRIDPEDLHPLGDGRDALPVEGRLVPVLSLSGVLGLQSENRPTTRYTALLTGTPPDETVLVVDEFLSEEEVVMKTLDSAAAVPGALGATILRSGRVALIMNPATCIRLGATAAGPVRSPTGETQPDGTTVRRRVLLAEDTITTRALERSILEAAGYEVLVAVDGMHAWQLLEEHGADAIVSDVDMPRMNGIALCEAARRSSRFRDVPFILVTSLASETDRRRGADAGANAYLVKTDFDQELLLDTLERLL